MIRPVHTLLLVEDGLLDREQYRRYLMSDSSCTYRLLEAESAATGLALCATQTIDAILLNYSLPDRDGLAFLEALHTQNRGSHLPVVMVSSEGDERIAVRAMKLGAEDYLSKRHLTPELLQLTLESDREYA
ncbi:MAG: response regulator [Plectolyngbya sp. WJT66-NPBG17]|jgi:CheY-like chemotaxis protein|nr:response regulator [Plectolyngbya sp. WJT66-NPBG17]MBW4524201.1 response regulator [Phormidium tanganyikae FI6-MK23]